VVVVSCSATETPRLLFNSATKPFPRGLGNNNDWVGRNLQGHAYSGAVGLFEEDLFDGLGPAARVACCDFSHGLPNGLKGGALIANEFIRLPYLYSRTVAPQVPRWGIEHKRFVRKNYKRSVGVMGPGAGDAGFREPRRTGAGLDGPLGLPSLRISGHRHSHDVEVGKFIAAKCEDWLKEAGAVATWKLVAGRGVSGGQHQAGTCRMGADPKTSVVDRYCRIHDLDNVYVVDGSVHVNNGGVQSVADNSGHRLLGLGEDGEPV
jgi:hypothetical protein